MILHDPLASSPSSGLDSPSHHSRKRFVHEKPQPTSDKDIQSRIQTASDIARNDRCARGEPPRLSRLIFTFHRCSLYRKPFGFSPKHSLLHTKDHLVHHSLRTEAMNKEGPQSRTAPTPLIHMMSFFSQVPLLYIHLTCNVNNVRIPHRGHGWRSLFAAHSRISLTSIPLISTEGNSPIPIWTSSGPARRARSTCLFGLSLS